LRSSDFVYKETHHSLNKHREIHKIKLTFSGAVSIVRVVTSREIDEPSSIAHDANSSLV